MNLWLKLAVILILHSVGETGSRTLLYKGFDAIAPPGTIAIAEWLVNEDRTSPLNATIFALNRLMSSEQGDTRLVKYRISQKSSSTARNVARSIDQILHW